MITTNRIIAIAGAVVAVLLQVLLAPHIAVSTAIPNFMVAYCLAIGLVQAEEAGPLLPFVMGLAYDLLSGGPVGVMAFSLTAIATLESWLFRRANNDTLFMAIAVLAASVFLVEMVYGVLFLLFGYAAGFFEALVYRVLPCFIYDLVISVVLYLIVVRLLNRNVVSRSEITQL